MKRWIMDEFDIQLSFEEANKRMHLEEEEDIALMRSLCDRAVELAKPKAICRECTVNSIQGDQVILSGTTFESRVMAENLKNTQTVYAYAVTCGREVDDWSHKETDPVVGIWLDMVKEMILGKAIEQFFTRLAHEQNIQAYATMSPGSGNLDVWPIGQQKKLFALIGEVEQNTGLRLTESCLMLPTKSVSGILYPSKEGFITCMLCTRAHCPNRRAPYDPSKREALSEA